jgi:Ca2+-dependent lipid-binding protein
MILQSADIKLLGALTQDDIKKLCGGEQPLWVSFPQFERVRWLNKQLEKIWPSVAEAARVVIKESVEPILESYRPPVIAKLKFNKLFLGNVAPKIDGVRMQTLTPGQVTMDLDFKWGGDPSIVLGVHTLIGAVLPVQLKNFSFFATVRVIFQLCEEMPCISAVVVALLAKPKPEIKYTFKVIGGSLTAVPGLSDMIRDLVENVVTDQLEWPHRIVVPISPNPGDLSHLYLKLQGQVTVNVIKAEKLKNMEMVGKSDPYVVLNVRPLWKFKTKVIDNNLNPEWNEIFALNVEDQETQALHFKVMDEDIGQDKTLGVVSYPLVKLVPEETVKLQLPLLPSLDTDRIKDKKDRGFLIVEVILNLFKRLILHASQCTN